VCICAKGAYKPYAIGKAKEDILNAKKEKMRKKYYLIVF